jgi:beta-lactamase regulating signal transducer with metallopeptidase domain
MIAALVAIAIKSLVIASATLALLALFRGRSAAHKSLIAHSGLAALLLLALAPLALPAWQVEAPAALSANATTEAPVVPSLVRSSDQIAVPASAPSASLDETRDIALPPGSALAAAYAIPAIVLLLITLLALGRLVALRARAEVLVDGTWLSAMARAQRRMGFKHGTALLTSDDLRSPISWGLMRPVILLNGPAVAAAEDAEAIISHELAHVARLDWAKLLLARLATALFWFNPLVWILAREAHQLREEAADDLVLAADIAGTDYAQLLVGVARHECPALLLGAHGVAPSKSSLTRRVARVLDAATPRSPVSRAFASSVLAGAVLLSAPLAALTLSTADPARDLNGMLPTTASIAMAEPAALSDILASGVASAVAVAVAAPAAQAEPAPPMQIASATAVAMAAHPAPAVIARADSDDADDKDDDGDRDREDAKSEVRRAFELKTTGVTPEFAAAIRASSPRLANIDIDELSALRAVGVDGEYARSMIAVLPNISTDDLVEARAVGLKPDYIRAMNAAGVRASVDGFVELWSVGVRPSYVERLRRSGYTYRNLDELVEMSVLGLDGEDMRMARRQPPPTPTPPPALPAPPRRN